MRFSSNMLLSLARLRFVSASPFEHRPGAITPPSAAAARSLCLNPVLQRASAADADSCPTSSHDSRKLLTAVPTAALPRPYS